MAQTSTGLYDNSLQQEWQAAFNVISQKRTLLLGVIAAILFPLTLIDIGMVRPEDQAIFVITRFLPSALIAISILAQKFAHVNHLATVYVMILSIILTSTIRVNPQDTSNYLLLNGVVYVMLATIPSIKLKHVIITGFVGIVANITAFFLFYAKTIPLQNGGLLIVVALVVMYALVSKFRYDILKTNFLNSNMLKKQNAEIEKQRNDLLELNEEIFQQKEEIMSQRDAIEEKNSTLSKALVEIERKNEKITASINYASRIQAALLSLEEDNFSQLKEKFVLFRPRDIVSGDFYWVHQDAEKIFLAAVDCTGHGVPGAFMSMIGGSLLDLIVVNKKITAPAKILQEMDKAVRKALKQEETQNRDGMDMSLCMIDKKSQKLHFAGAARPLVYIQQGKLHQLKGNVQSVGGYHKYRQGGLPFAEHIIDVSTPTAFYIFSDGYQDQFGGPNGKKFMLRRLREMLLSIHELPMSAQKEYLEKELDEWITQGRHLGKMQKQMDDILLIGVRV